MISEGKNSHFILIRDFSAVFREGGNVWKKKRYFCENCLSPSRTPDALSRHEEICGRNEPTRVVVPQKGKNGHMVEFSSWRCLLKVPWVIYADFEAMMHGKDVQEHEVSSFSYHIKCQYEDHAKILGAGDKPLGEIRNFCGRDAIDRFWESLLEDEATIMALAQTNLEYDGINKEADRDDFLTADVCHICRKKFLRDSNGDYMVAVQQRHFDHDHYTGKYRGAAHASCNMQLSSSKHLKIPVVFHNLKVSGGLG